MKYNTLTKDIALMGIYLSLFLAIGFIPNVGLIYIPPVYLTTFPILMFIIIFLHQDLKFSIFAGLAFGFTSLLMAVFRPMGSKDWLYLNPLISIMPRVIWSLLVYFLILIGPKKWLQFVWLIFIIFTTYWVHAFISDVMKFMFYVWAGGYSWHNNNLFYSLGLVWGVEHLIEVAIYTSTIPFIIFKTNKNFRTVNIDKKIAVFDFSRTIAFGAEKERRVPENIRNHLKALSDSHEIIVITGRRYKKVEEELNSCDIYNIISSNGAKISLNGIKYNGYYGFRSRLNSIKFVDSITKGDISYIVSDNKCDLCFSKKYKMFRPKESSPSLRSLPEYAFN